MCTRQDSAAATQAKGMAEMTELAEMIAYQLDRALAFESASGSSSAPPDHIQPTQGDSADVVLAQGKQSVPVKVTPSPIVCAEPLRRRVPPPMSHRIVQAATAAGVRLAGPTNFPRTISQSLLLTQDDKSFQAATLTFDR